VPERKLLEEHGSGPIGAAESDAVLTARAAAGDRLAYVVLVRRHLPRVYAVTRRMLGNEAAAEDAAQEALLRLWTHAGSYDSSKAMLSTWLTRIATNLCLDRLRKRQEEQWDDSYDVALPSSQERTIGDRQLAARVDAALQALPERQRTALVLCHYEDLSMAEAAAAMQISVEAVESLLSRARRSLKQRLAPDWRSLLPDGGAEP
jgi:RNA polymerase sigma-70 factor (ECF subfamily)